MKLPNHVSESVKKLNPGLYLGADNSAVGECHQEAALVKGSQTQRRRARGLALVVSIVAFRNRRLDGDNSESGGIKALRDAISASIGIDDGDPRVRWEYGQHETRGQTGVLVKVERL